jgi:branched-chain amino acid transport system substrate-binding protein
MTLKLLRKTLPVFLLLICALLAFGVEPQSQQQQEKKADAPAVSGDSKAQSDARKKEVYGNMPEDLVPYHDFARDPYHKYFVPSDAAITFWGPGRDKPDPEVEKVMIGMMAPVERSHETYIGRSMLNATRMALDEANAAGGYKGKPFDIIVRNDTGLWGASANEVVSFTYDDNVWAILGTVDGANSHIAIRVALRTDIPMVNVADLDPTLMETRIPWVFRVIPDDRQMAYTIAYYVYKQLGLQKVAILRANNRYGRFGVAQFRKSSIRLSKPAPIEVNYEVNYENVNPDFTAQIDRLQKAQPDAIILWADPQPAAWLVKKMREADMKIPVVACERIISPSFLQIAGEAAEGVVATSPYNPDSDNPRLVAFKKKYIDRFGAPPDAYAAHSYDGTQMLIEAIKKAGLNRYRIRDALADMNRWEGVTGDIIMDDVFTNRRPVCVTTVKGGRFVYGTPHFDHLF